MKLYATVTSERASKGQGGNREVVINLKIDPKKRMEVGKLVMRCEDDTYTIYYYPINQNCTDQELKEGRLLLYQSKCQKFNCKVCGQHVGVDNKGESILLKTCGHLKGEKEKTV